MNRRGMALLIAAIAAAGAVGAWAQSGLFSPLTQPGLTSDGNPPISNAQASALVGTLVQSTKTTTDSTGSFSVTWSKSFASSTPYAHADAVIPSATLPMVCQVYTATQTTVTGKCFQSMTTTLGGTITAIAGTVVSPFQNASAGVDVRVVARDATQ